MTLDSLPTRGHVTGTVLIPQPRMVNGHPVLTNMRPELDPQLVADKARELLALEQQQGPRVFAEEVADILLAPEPDPVEIAALRCDEVAFLAWNATKYLLEHSGLVIRERIRRRQHQEANATRRFQVEINREQRILKAIVEGIRARNGRLPNERNPKRRAERRLVQENLKGDVPKGRFIEILREEEELAQQIKRDQKRARAQARKNRGR